MLTTPDPIFDVALALTALLAVSAGQDRLWEPADPGTTQGGWLPWMVLAAFAIASSIFGVLHPQAFAAASGQGMPDPGALVVALGQL